MNFGQEYENDMPVACWQCDGQGWGIIGCDWDTRDAVNGPYDGEVEDCPCCGGSGEAEDCTYW